MDWMELDGLDGAGWSWMELDRPGALRSRASANRSARLSFRTFYML